MRYTVKTCLDAYSSEAFNSISKIAHTVSFTVFCCSSPFNSVITIMRQIRDINVQAAI